MFLNDKIWIGRGDEDCYLLPKMANRHGLIAGATGTGKTITLKVLAESFSAMGVPVFLADIKGDLSGMIESGAMSDSLLKRLARFGLSDYPFQSFPTCFWDVYGEKGHPIRTTISEMGPTLLSRIMNLSDVQASVLSIIFRIADDNGLLLIDMKDLKAMIQHVTNSARELSSTYGNMSTQSLNALLRNVMVLEDEGGDIFFGEPAIDIADWMKFDVAGRGYINLLDCTRLFQHPTLYATFMLWLLDELFETLPEVGDCDKPKLVFFFDEAHLLFNEMPKSLLSKIEQMVKLIRSKGVGVYFITQNPTDIPDSVLAQLANRIQHALRAYTPKELKAVKVAAETFRANPNFDTAEEIGQLGTGEALISTLDEKGIPTVVQRATILCPQSKMGEGDQAVRIQIMAQSEMGAKYDELVDRYSAYESLEERSAMADQLYERQARIDEFNAQARTLQKQLEAQNAALQKQVNQLALKAGLNLPQVTEKTIAPAMLDYDTIAALTGNPLEGADMNNAAVTFAQQDSIIEQQAALEQQRMQQAYQAQQQILMNQRNVLMQQLEDQKAALKQADLLERQRQQMLRAEAERLRKEEEAKRKAEEQRRKQVQRVVANSFSGLTSSFGREVGRTIARSIFGTTNKKKW